MKNREKIVLKTMCFFDIDFSLLFFDFSRFWLDSMCASARTAVLQGGIEKRTVKAMLGCVQP